MSPETGAGPRLPVIGITFGSSKPLSGSARANAPPDDVEELPVSPPRFRERHQSQPAQELGRGPPHQLRVSGHLGGDGGAIDHRRLDRPGRDGAQFLAAAEQQACRADHVALARVAEQGAGGVPQLHMAAEDDEAGVRVRARAQQVFLVGEDAGAAWQAVHGVTKTGLEVRPMMPKTGCVANRDRVFHGPSRCCRACLRDGAGPVRVLSRRRIRSETGLQEQKP